MLLNNFHAFYQIFFSHLSQVPRSHLCCQYCSGAAYLITPSLMSSFLAATAVVPAIPLDDIYMTGRHVGGVL